MNTIIRNIYKCFGLGLVVAFSVVAQGCSNDDGLTDGTAASRHAVFVVDGVDAKTRVAYSDYISSEFDLGDELGACVVEKTDEKTDDGFPIYQFMEGFENVRYKVVDADYTYTDKNNVSITYTRALAPVIPMDVFPTEQRYVFYYPYKAGADVTNFNHTVLADQSIKEAFETSDLLRARVNGTTDISVIASSELYKDAGNQYLDVSMEHVMASIVLKVEKDLVNAATSEATLLNVHRSVSGIDLTRALSSDDQTNADYPDLPGESTDIGNVKMWNTGEGTGSDAGYIIYRAVIPAQKIDNNVELELDFVDGGTKKYAISTVKDDLTFQPNNYYLFTVTKNDGLRFRGIIEDLEEGGDYYYEY